MGCAASESGGPPTGGTTGSNGGTGGTSTPTGGTGGTTTPSGGTSGGGSGGTGGSAIGGTGGSATGGSGGGGTGGAGGGTFQCPTVTTPGDCSPPADIRCPAPKLSLTGCISATPFSDTKVPLKMASNVIPYEVNSPLWSDGAYKTRGMRLPTGGKIHVKDCAKNPDECKVLDPNTFKCCAPTADDGKWVFPVGTVMVKNFAFPDSTRPSGYKVVETRLLVRLDKPAQVAGVSTEWVGYSYQWDDAQTDAKIVGTLAVGSDVGVSATFQVKPPMAAATQPITWNYPSRADCITCHVAITPATTPTSGYTLGPETIQMNRTVAGDTMNQIDKLAALNAFETPPSKPYKAALVVPYDGQAGSVPAGATLEQRARSYLHANCSFCHRPDGLWPGFDVRYDVPFASTTTCNAPPGKGDQGVTGATLLTPKDPSHSVIYLRMVAPAATATSGGTGRMPAIASVVVDQQGTKLISDWINSITTCPM
ncbi:MAG TPA: hypothetical protein VHJ20_21115 [Polyangia bacterium]|nr:hypothetical protein [Polyangia bacterium]